MGSVSIFCQDPSYGNFLNNRFLFNPSLTGTSGSESFKLRAKSQWYNDGGQGYKTISLLFEETMPCSIIDIGAKINYNEEGAGFYRTIEAGFLSSAFIPLRTRNHDFNFRIGVDFTWGLNSIDYSRLVWSDQLHPKYGVIEPTSFSAPNDGQSNSFLNPGIGVSWRALWNKTSKQAIMTNIGIAGYRFVSFIDGEIGQSISVLGLDNNNPMRYSVFFESEFIPYYYGHQYLSIKPILLMQRQGPLDYIELGARLGYSRYAGISAFYHTTLGFNQYETKWMTLSTDFTVNISNTKKLDILLSYSSNLSGLKNFSGPQFEFGIAYHLAKSSVCNLMGQGDDVPYNDEYKCPIMMITPGKQKMYENIWYK